MENINKHFNLLGMRVEDKVTKFSGIVTSIAFDLYGCIQALVHPGLDKDGKLLDLNWFDVGRLKIISEHPSMQRPNYNWVHEVIVAGKKGPEGKPANLKV